MTEVEWLTSTAASMLEFLRGHRMVTRTTCGRRKLHLFGVACCRRGLYVLPKSARQASEAALLAKEDFAEGTVPGKELTTWWHTASRRLGVLFQPLLGETVRQLRCYAAACSVRETMRPEAWPAASQGSKNAFYAIWKRNRRQETDPELVHQRALVQCIFGNPFHSVRIDPVWLTANNGTALTLVQDIDNERAFREMPILADALEDAGCTNEDILAHCRGPGPHARGCWVVDHLLAQTRACRDTKRRPQPR
jgi:hypothetical protein